MLSQGSHPHIILRLTAHIQAPASASIGSWEAEKSMPCSCHCPLSRGGCWREGGFPCIQGISSPYQVSIETAYKNAFPWGIHLPLKYPSCLLAGVNLLALSFSHMLTRLCLPATVHSYPPNSQLPETSTFQTSRTTLLRPEGTSSIIGDFSLHCHTHNVVSCYCWHKLKGGEYNWWLQSIRAYLYGKLLGRLDKR